MIVGSRLGRRLISLVAITSAASLFGLWLQSTGLGDWVELKSYDVRFQLRGELPPSPDVPITVLAIDEASLAELTEPLVFWQRHFQVVLEELAAAGAAAVGVDWVFADIEGIDPATQRRLAATLLRAKAAGVPIVLGYRRRAERVEQPPALFVMAAGTDSFAYLNLTTDPDDFVRRQELFSAEGRPGFALALAQAFLASGNREVGADLKEERTRLINFREPGHFRRVSFSTAVRAAEAGNEDFFARFAGHLVLIGRIGEAGDEDLHSTPFYGWSSDSSSRRMPGIDIHASTITSLIEDDFISRVSGRTEALVTAGVALLGTLFCLFLSPQLGILLSLGTLLLFLLAAFLRVFEAGWWVPVVSPAAASFLAIGLTQATNFVLEGREKLRLRRLFRSYVSDQVIEKILEAPDELVLRGESKTVSILFADVMGFTSRSEGEKPENIVTCLNSYFTAMVDAIQDNHGMVDKFIGDGIMAVFGAPLDDPDCALHSVQAAQAMVEALDKLNPELEAQGFPPLGIGVGIHTGEAVIGNIGSPQKMDYTAIGDTVNTASRIESLTRKLETPILMSGDTARALGDHVPAEYLGDHKVKGKEELVAIYRPA